MTTMSTETILSAAPALSEADLARAQQELRDGHLLVVPTDTVYGIGADAANPEAVAAVLAAKGRGRQMPPPFSLHPSKRSTRCASMFPMPPARSRVSSGPADSHSFCELAQTSGGISVRPAERSACACRTKARSCDCCATSGPWP